MQPKIGILGGIGPESSAEFYLQLILLCQSKGITSNTEYPHILLESIPAPELMLQNIDLTMYAQGIQNLENSGADFIVIICNTAYIYSEQITRKCTVPIINLQEEVQKYLLDKQIDIITVIGSKKTSKQLYQFPNIKSNMIHETDIDSIIFDFNNGKDKEILKHKLLDILEKYNNEHILISCTELSLLLENEKRENHHDTFTILLNATYSAWKNNTI